MKITLTAGRAHIKHTEGGDFRQATYRAIRQGLRSANNILLEPWYDFNGSIDKEAVLLANPELLSLGEELALDLIRDSFRSFPSGHTASSAAVYGFLYLPFCLDKFNNKKSKILLNVLTVVFTGLVAFGRIIVGAHYFSDVLFGGTITYASLWLSALIFEKLRIKILEKEPMLINE
jgi:membrane-associated phospholipid phosphatase